MLMHCGANTPPPPKKKGFLINSIFIMSIPIQYDNIFKAVHMVKKEKHNRFGSMPK